METTVQECNSVDDAPVAVLGAGPVGLALANELSWRGIRSVLIDRLVEPHPFPSSESLHARTMEHFRRWGIAEEIRHAGFPIDMQRNVAFVTRLNGYSLGHIERPSNRQQRMISSADSPEGPIWCPKFLFEGVMRKRLQEAGNTELMLGFEVDGASQDDEGVELRMRHVGSGKTLSRRFSYLAACDGGQSGTRKALDIQLQGTFAEGRNFGIFFRSRDLSDLMNARSAVMAEIINPDFSANLSAVDGKELWRLNVFTRDREPAGLDPRQCIRDAAGADVSVDIIDARVWAGHTAVAESYGRGRIFLVGDSCHLLWPRGGFGANTGIGDAVDLGWKLDAVLRGWGGEQLLSSYEAERRPIAVRNVSEAGANYRAEAALVAPPHLEEDSARGEAERRQMSEAILATRKREWNTIGFQLSYTYGTSPICWLEAEAATRTEDLSVYAPTTRPGARAPHIWLGNDVSTLDSYGRSHCLVHDVDVDVSSFVNAAGSRNIPFSTLVLEEEQHKRLYERPLVLVRPDGHVGWRSDKMPNDAGVILDHCRGLSAARPH